MTNKRTIGFTQIDSKKNKPRLVYFLKGTQDPLFINFLNNIKNINFYNYNLWLVGGMTRNKLTKDIDLILEGKDIKYFYEINNNLINLSLKLNLVVDIWFQSDFKECQDIIKKFLYENINLKEFKLYAIRDNKIKEVKNFLNLLKNNEKYKKIPEFCPICLVQNNKHIYKPET